MPRTRDCSAAMLVLILSVAVNTAAANTLDEHSSDLLKAALWAIGILFGMLQSVVVWIFVSTTKDLRHTIERLDQEKMDRAEHDRICERQP